MRGYDLVAKKRAFSHNKHATSLLTEDPIITFKMFRRRQNKKELELNVTDGKNIVYDEEIPIEDIDSSTPHDSESPKNEVKPMIFETTESDESTEAEDDTPSTKNSRFISDLSPTDNNVDSSYMTTMTSRRLNPTSKPGPSRENTLENRPKSGARTRPILSVSESESESDDGLMIMEQPRGPIPGEYDAEKYNDLQVTDQIKDIFQYITKYTPQHLNLDYKFKPFIPDYIPAVGDIDAFLKVVPPEKMISSGEPANFSELGLAVLDEPAANQSDSALLHLQLRAVSVTTNKDNKNMIIKKIDNVEKNSKTIDKWIHDISDLHRAKPPPMVKYTNPMPDIDSLMQEWPQSLEMLLRKDGFPRANLDCSLSEYIDLVCAIFDIPVYEKKIQSVHLLFCLFVAIKNSQLYNVGNQRENMENDEIVIGNEKQFSTGTTDQLILD